MRSSSGTVSGTKVAAPITDSTRVSGRSSKGTARPWRMCATPATSLSSVRTGKREWPLVRASSSMSVTVSPSSRESILPRGTIASWARRSPKARVRWTSEAVSSARAPSSAERLTSTASSSALRAEPSSSCGSTPSARTTALALPLNRRIGRPNTVVNSRWKPTT